MKIPTKLFWLKKVALTLVIILLTETCLPTISLALTSGPSKPEVQSFEPISTTEMVDMFSGDFTYNIPLFELPGPNGGYPFNLHYNAGITMDQEASWVGLGWNLNPGAINRDMKGLPDEYKNKLVKSEVDIKPSESYGVSPSVGIEIFGAETEKFSAEIQLNLGVTMKYNNYKGYGYSLDVGLDAGKELSGGQLTAGLGLNLSLDSESGIGVNVSPSLSLGGADDYERVRFQVGVGYSSSEGLNKYSFSTSVQRYVGPLLAKKLLKFEGQSGTSSYTVMSGGYIPPVSNPMQSRYTTTHFKVGGSVFGIFADVSLAGFYNTQYLDQITKNHNANGYLYSEKDNGKDMLDFNREKDGMLHKRSPNLPAPISTPDIFTMTSHGMTTMFRAFRNDAGAYHDLEMIGKSVGGSGGAEIGSHVGVDATFGYGETKTVKWTDQNAAVGNYAFNSSFTSPGQENYYFKTYGEATSTNKNTYNSIGDEDPVAFKINAIGADKNRNLSSSLVKKDGSLVANSSSNYVINTTTRAPRNTPIQYIDPENPDKGMYAINSDGSMYIFGKSQKVNSNAECIYSIEQGFENGVTVQNNFIPNVPKNGNGTLNYKNIDNNIDYYYNKKTLTDYPYTYLITEIRGADYVDADGSGTVTTNDKGYWVKFNYVNKSTAYKWRSPYYGANFVAGKLTTIRDNKATFSYGEKEVSYLESVETNSHIATFYMSPRKDARGATGELATDSDSKSVPGSCDYSYRLDYITLQSKANPSKNLMKVMFDYSYALCKDVLNNAEAAAISDKNFLNENHGKLTLEKVWIEYENNTRGKMNPYKFDYHKTVKEENPNYVTNNYDRWGNNRLSLDVVNANNPYTPQFNSTNPSDPNYRASVDVSKAAWSLKALTLPSGAIINIDYEADDYAYVQNVRAGQMFKIYGLSTGATPATVKLTPNGDIASNYSGSNERRVVFELENPIYDTPKALDTLKMQYTEGLSEIYYKIYGSLLSAGDPRKDYISGYAKVSSVGLEPIATGETKYLRAYIILATPQIGPKPFPKYHPFSIAFWQSLMTDYSEIAFTGKIAISPNESKSERRAKLTSLVSMFGKIGAMFQGFYNYANSAPREWGRRIDLNKSFIRLHAPDKIKIGGNIRVKKITLSDQWNKMHTNATESVYGQVYDYTTTDARGITISSGVATYEPMTGGDENPLRNAKQFIDKIPLKLSNNVFFETPVNESYYPGASVGYSKITVKSLASYQNEQKKGAPLGILTTGAVCSEFYTCKEFPVINSETPIVNLKDQFINVIPLIGTVTDIRVTASQGYAIQLNDMHGKPKKTSTYAQASDGSILYNSPVSYIEYKYKSDKYQTGTTSQDYYCVLNNKVPVLTKNSNGDIVQSNNYLVGEQIEFYTDMREQTNNNTVTGVNINLDLVTAGPFPIPIPAVWPSMNYTRTRVRTAVTNKIIHKFGLIDSIIAYTGGSTVRTKNLVFDGVTGEAVLTSVSNNFDDKVYNFNMPSHMVYAGLASAYKTVGTAITGNLSSGFASGLQDRNKERTITTTPGAVSLVSQGDILTFYNDLVGTNKYTGIVTHVAGNLIYIQTSITTPQLTGTRFYISYPGSRNQLNAKSGSVRTLESPSLPGPSNPLDQLYPFEP